MRVHLLVWGLLLGSSLAAFCQGRDTVFAVHKLFREKRGSAKGLQAFSDSAAVKAYRAQRAVSPLTAQERRQDAVASAAFTGVGLLKGARYSAEFEAYVLRQYAAGGPIPPGVRRKHFHRTAKDVSLDQ